MAQGGLNPPIPLPYRLFFLYLEPLATALGALYAFDAFGLQTTYLHLTYPSPSSSPAGLLLNASTRESIVLNQLANLYLVFALNEALVLRATNDVHVWRVLLLGLLIADFGHLYSVHAVGWGVYYQFWTWSSMYWGNLGFVYVGATMRGAFLGGMGFRRRQAGGGKVKT
ncbi:hypothetical protein B0A55_13395 [Friedmanniomyces simplex]|uniref:DUF7704 domain-containing protein n=1 Tax=Friedmanniomyces simplex TaxID=329884 RepID=A0A4U0VT31_9PEZI|nr:hypothetical protein B0A55_13395 [Friedmanniomyces simplex]